MEIVVKVPETTPEGAVVYLAGDRGDVGGWRADGLRLTRQTDGTWATRLPIGPGERLQYKFTLGEWDRVEMDALGRDVPNRIVPKGAADPLMVEVQGWTLGRGHSVMGDLRVHPQVHSAALSNYRTVWVWLPPGYGEGSARYPVLYMHDGQNLFDAGRSAFGNEWEVDETATRLIAEGTVRPFIVVGVENTPDRFGEYTPTRCGGTGGRGPAYGRFLTEELKPYIDAHYRTAGGPDNTFVAGSSLGGLISLYLLHAHPDIFGGCAAMSPSLWWNGGKLMADAMKDASWARGKRIWIDMGTGEAGWGDPERHVARVVEMEVLLRAAGAEVACEIEEGAGHCEAAWAGRLPRAMRHLMKQR